ncbi:hypothetical protein [Sphingomonas adhaesiva]|uniref:hypothetical protein n=1 Tax=Sphingomonas adhaesiva TaxID=28212 RepID=UPI002FFB3C0B
MTRRSLSIAAGGALLLAACQQQPAPPPAATPTPSPSASPGATASAAVGALTRYVGSYPSDTVGTSSFLSDPAVRAAVASAVPDPGIRERVLDAEATATPIALVEGRVLSYACEPHNCGPHNWAIAVTPDARTAAVCYYDQDAQEARWYPQSAGPNPEGGCPSGE